MTPETLRQLIAIQSRHAAELRRAPAVIHDVETALETVMHAPWLGEYLHQRWARARHSSYKDALHPWHYAALSMDDDWLWLYCDASGWGEDGEPALSVRDLELALVRMVGRARERRYMLGVGFVEMGLFQSYLGFYEI